MGLEIIIGAICLAVVAGITSYCSQRRAEEDRQEVENDATTVDITSTTTETTEPSGVTTTTTTQHIKIEDFDRSKITKTETTSETGRENDVASTIAGAASGGFGAVAGTISARISSGAAVLLTPGKASSDSDTPSPERQINEVSLTQTEGSAEESLDSSKTVLDLIQAATAALEDGHLTGEEMQQIAAIAISGDSDSYTAAA